MLEFNKRVLFVGFGAVARCTLPILVKHAGVQESGPHDQR